MRAAEQAAAADDRARAAYRAGAHLPSAPAVLRLGRLRARARPAGNVVVAGCRDAAAARQLGFVETRSLGAALGMVHGMAEGAEPRIGWLLAPPYFPLRVRA